METKLVMCNVPTTNFKSSLAFYASLFGVDPGDFIQNPQSPIEQYYRPISADGVDLTISAKNDTRDTTIMYFAVGSVEKTVSLLTELGGKVILENERLAEGSGHLTLMVDPDGNYVGLMQLAEEPAQYFRFGDFRELTDGLEQRLAEARSGAQKSAG